MVQAFDAGEVDGVHFLVMERIDGEDLSTLLKRRDTLPVAEACELIRQAAEGLQCVHEHEMVHRDIKPSNLMLARNGQVKLLDLGLAMLRRGSELTGTGQQMGTFDYMAPEQRDNSREVDIRADIYSLGATLYKLLCGQPRFMAETWAETKKELKQRDIPQPLIDLLKRLLAKDPALRMAEPQEVARALQPFTDGANLQNLFLTADELASATALLPAAPAESGRSRRIRRLIALAGGFVFLAAALTIYVVTDRGVLVIETFDDDLKVEVQKNGKSIGDAWELEAGENRMTIRSGEYTVVIVGENADKFKVDKDRVTLTRNGEKRVQITRVAKAVIVKDKQIIPADNQQPAEPQPTTHGPQPPPAVVPFDSRQADKHQQAWAKYLGLAPEFVNSLDMRFRLIPPGKFTMGGGQSNPPVSEWMPHEVTLTLAYFMGVYEVKQEQYEKLMGSNPSHFVNAGRNAPVENLTYDEAREFCAKLTQLSQTTGALPKGYEYRLPSEAQWEFAARAGSSVTRHYTLSRVSKMPEWDAIAWNADNSQVKYEGAIRGRGTHPVGRKSPNPWHLYDMQGNVSEWCADYYAAYRPVAVSDPVGPPVGKNRVVRRGNWGMAKECWVLYSRGPVDPAHCDGSVGLRVAVVLKSKSD